jgi:hypothetical protein
MSELRAVLILIYRLVSPLAKMLSHRGPDSGKRSGSAQPSNFAQRRRVSGFAYVRLRDVREHFKVKLANYGADLDTRSGKEKP